jgi:hypothetical protein
VSAVPNRFSRPATLPLRGRPEARATRRRFSDRIAGAASPIRDSPPRGGPPAAHWSGRGEFLPYPSNFRRAPNSDVRSTQRGTPVQIPRRRQAPSFHVGGSFSRSGGDNGAQLRDVGCCHLCASPSTFRRTSPERLRLRSPLQRKAIDHGAGPLEAGMTIDPVSARAGVRRSPPKQVFLTPRKRRGRRFRAAPVP